MKRDNNEILQNIEKLLAEQNVNLARLLMVMETAANLQSRAVTTDEGLRVEVRQRPQQQPLLVVPR